MTTILSHLGIVAWIFVVVCCRVPQRNFTKLRSSELSAIATLQDTVYHVNSTNPESHLAHILIPRSPDTANNTAVRNYLIQQLNRLGWDVEEDSFTANTPYGPKRFANVIATKNPNAPRRLVLAAHFDTKFFKNYPDNQFVGAIDSAASCAILLDLAETLNPLLDAQEKTARFAGTLGDNHSAYVTPQIVFFDGEEALEDWAPTDSLYGAQSTSGKKMGHFIYQIRHSAIVLRKPDNQPSFYGNQTILSSVEHLILLDLLGASHPTIRSYIPSTGWLFDRLVDVEAELGAAGVLDEVGHKWDIYRDSFFLPRTWYRSCWRIIEDDHLPFLRQGVDVLHLIPWPFPNTWHTLSDDASALDLPTMKRWNMIMRAFVAEYLGLSLLGSEFRMTVT